MKRKTIPRDAVEKLVKNRPGWKMAGPEHPVYSEGPSITSSSRTPDLSDQKAIVSLPIDSESDSGSPLTK